MQSWHGTCSTKRLKNFVLCEAQRLEGGPLNQRTIRQLTDARRFLEMIDEPKYYGCKRISDLKLKIADERNKLREACATISKFLPGYQLTIFDMNVNTSEEERKSLESERKVIEEQIHWLHKCLGICHNKEYFR